MSVRTKPKHHNVNIGVLYGCIAALIWGTWPVVTAIGVKADFTPYELIFLRLTIAGPILLPWAFRGDNSPKSWGQAAVLSLLAGGTYSYVTASGFQYTSAMHGGVIIPGAVMLVSLIASHFLLKDHLTRNRAIGGAAILVGLTLLALGSGNQNQMQSSLFGDGLFFFAGIMWASYTLLLRAWPMDPITVTARVSLISLMGVLLAYPFSGGVDFSDTPTSMLLTQAAWQGILSSVVAIIFFNKGVAILGAARAGVVNAFVPVVATVMD
ncbi:MAG: DMT family transporter, partial [Kordiimonas sp.]